MTIFFLKIQKAVNEGAVHIFSTTVLNKIIAVLTNIVVVRILTKDEFGYFSYAYNIVMILMSFSGLGTSTAILQYGCESKNKSQWLKKEKMLVLVGFLSSLLFSIGTLLYALFVPLSVAGGKWILVSLAFLPIIQYYFTYLSMKFRVLEKNKEYALITNLQSVSYFVAACLGGMAFSVAGTVLGRYLGYFVPVIVGICLLKKEIKEVNEARINMHCKEEMKYSFWVLLNNVSSSIYYYFDVLIIGIVLSDVVALADYKVATQIPTALVAIPMAIATFVYPKFVRQQDNPQWILKNYHLVQLSVGALNLVITVCVVLLAPFIISVIYGDDYIGAVYPFRILMFSYFMSGTFRTLTGHILSMLHQVKANFGLGIIGCIVNICATFVLVKAYGGIGAAYATLIVVVVESFASSVYFYWYIRKKKLRELEALEKITEIIDEI